MLFNNFCTSVVKFFLYQWVILVFDLSRGMMLEHNIDLGYISTHLSKKKQQ